MEGLIEVCADWTAHRPPARLGTLRIIPGRSEERFEFAFDDAALADEPVAKRLLDPDLAPYAGRQFPKGARGTFGIFKDASPDQIGRASCRERV